MAEAAGAFLAIQAIGAIGQTIGQYNVAEQTAKGAEQEALSLQDTMASMERQARRRSGLASAKGRAIAAASGIDPGSGSPLLVDLENARQSELEALDIRRIGAVGVQQKQYQAQLARAAKPGIILGGVSSGASILGNWAKGRIGASPLSPSPSAAIPGGY